MTYVRRRGAIYLLHFERRFHHAGHYVGFTLDLPARLAEHRRGNGSRLLAAVGAVGIPWQLAAVWKGTRHDERRLKRNGSGARFCPICSRRPRSAKLRGLVTIA